MAKSPKPISEEFVKAKLIRFLANEGWSKNLEFGSKRDRGVDIKVTNSEYGRSFLIETKGASTSRSGFENVFIHSLGQIVTRMKHLRARPYYGLGLPKRSADIALRRVPYEFAVKTCLHILSVSDNGSVVWHKPADIKRLQQGTARSSRKRKARGQA
jgi:hypothetical protein